MAKQLVPSVEDIRHFLQHTPITAIQNWLKMNGKTYSTLTQSNYGKKLNKWISDGQITSEDISSIAFDIEESGGKKVYLRVLGGNIPKSQQQFEVFLNNINAPLISRTRRSVREPSSPTLNHIIREDGMIIVKFSELQEDVNFNTETEETETIPKTVFVVFKLDPANGFCEIRFDNPAKRHRHKDSDGKSSVRMFESYYFDKLSSLFAGTEIEIFGLNQIADSIVTKGESFFRINREQTTTTGGKQIYSAGNGDVRNLPARLGAVSADGANWVYDDITGYWIGESSEGSLLGDLFMRLSKDDSSLRFQRDCLSVEINYAIRKIRSLKE